eukprot:114660_1
MTLLLPFLLAFSASAEVFYKETFGDDWESRWTASETKSDYGKWQLSAGKYFGDEKESRGLQTSQDAKFYAISANLDKPVSNEAKSLVVQFEVKHEQNIDCGGGYLKIGPKWEAKKFEGDTKYFIMFGPDICGQTKKVHMIFNYKGQNLDWKKEPRAESDESTHLYTMVLNSDNTYELHVDGEKKESGSLEDDWAFLKPKEIPDPKDEKPADWVDEAEMDDPEDKKPEDWDKEPETIVDPDAKQPDDWDTEEDGEWEAPMISNPKYKGEWKAKRIPNPGYKGVWKAKDISNPDYVADANLYLFKDIESVGLDLWQVKSGTIFDNIIITDSLAEATAFAKETFHKYVPLEKKAKEKADEEARKAEAKEKEPIDKPDDEADDDTKDDDDEL